MNRILFEKSERTSADEVSFGGNRAKHVFSVLHVAKGDNLRLGEIGGARFDNATVLEVSAKSCRIRLGAEKPPLRRCPVDLLLALPRPKCLRRLWPQIAALGVGRIYVTAAEKVEKAYWGSTFLDPEIYQALLLEGLAQSGDTIAPQVQIHRRLKPFVQDVLPGLYNPSSMLLAHPEREENGTGENLSELELDPAGVPFLLAIGPEGGWSDFEVNMFTEAGFRRFSMGARILRTDTATIAALSILAARIYRVRE